MKNEPRPEPGREVARMNLNQQLELARVMSEATLLPKQYQRNPGNLLYAIKYAEGLGLPVIEAVTGIHVIEGKPSASANLIAALVRRAGHRLRITATATEATASIVRRDDPTFTFTCTWTIERAKAANLTGKSVWKNYPEAMLKARAITEVAREACSEALCGVIYTAEELGADGTVNDADDFEPAGTTVITIAQVASDGEMDRNEAVQMVMEAFGDDKAAAAAAWVGAGLPGKDTAFVSRESVQALLDSLPEEDIEEAVIVETAETDNLFEEVPLVQNPWDM